jgi:hypothetical protein
MRLYCKAYHLADLRRFPGWVDNIEGGDGKLADDTVVYLWDDLTVVTNPVVPGEGVLRDTVDEAWKRFCDEELRFHVPEDLVGDPG